MQEQHKTRVRIGIALLSAWECGCHEGWKDPICGHAFDILVKHGLMETRPDPEDDELVQRRLTPKGLGVLISLHDALTTSLLIV